MIRTSVCLVVTPRPDYEPRRDPHPGRERGYAGEWGSMRLILTARLHLSMGCAFYLRAVPNLANDAHARPDRSGLAIARRCRYFWDTVPMLARGRKNLTVPRLI